jgi:uncharacterized protein (DUF1800 family)
MALRVPSTQTRHLLNRFSYGVTPALVRQAGAHGGRQKWLEWQMRPNAIGDSFSSTTLSGWFPSLGYTPQQLWQQHASGRRPGWQVMYDFVRWSVLRRTFSQRQLLEVMADFWSNLLYVPVPVDEAWPYRMQYDRTIRAHALGTFEGLLLATITHPAMSCYLDNAKSTARDLNENLGRELLELHTVGRASGYAERDVLDSARILTGFTVDVNRSWSASYTAADHHVGAVRVLGFSSANAKADGRDVVSAYLRYLSRHPATARNLAQRLCVRFVRDEPSRNLVSSVAHAYLASGTDIKATIKALVNHPEFSGSVGAKVRTPSEDAIATYRALRLQPTRPMSDAAFANVVAWHTEFIGQRPFGWPRPDGPPDFGNAWTSSGRMLNSWSFHHTLAEGNPRVGVQHVSPRSWLPRLPARFDHVVDHISRRILVRPVSTQLLSAISSYTGIPQRRVIRDAGELKDWRITMLIATLLNSPQHMSR